MVRCACGSPNYHYNSEPDMPKRKTSRVRRKQKRRPQVLELRVISRRIVWIEMADWIKRLFKLALACCCVVRIVVTRHGDNRQPVVGMLSIELVEFR